MHCYLKIYILLSQTISNHGPAVLVKLTVLNAPIHLILFVPSDCIGICYWKNFDFWFLCKTFARKGKFALFLPSVNTLHYLSSRYNTKTCVTIRSETVIYVDISALISKILSYSETKRDYFDNERAFCQSITYNGQTKMLRRWSVLC